MSAVPRRVSAADRWERWYPVDGDEHADGLQAWRRADGRYFRLLYADGTEFFVDRLGSDVYATWPASSTIEDTSIYLLGPVLGFVLRLRGTICLHASAVDIGGRAIALLGAGEAGKSTTAAAFARRGYSVLTDDVSPLNERDGIPYLQPTYPQVRLWPDAVELLYGSEDALPKLTPNWTKCGLALAGRAFQDRPLPLAAIYVLGGWGECSQDGIESLAGREALRVLLAHSYVGYLLDRRMRRQEFDGLTRLAARIPVRRVVSPRDRSQVFRICSRILGNLEESGCTASPTTAR